LFTGVRERKSPAVFIGFTYYVILHGTGANGCLHDEAKHANHAQGQTWQIPFQNSLRKMISPVIAPVVQKKVMMLQ
jgi:hypothetical protein